MRKLPVILPSMRCDDGCGECCGVVPATTEEFSRIKNFVKQRGIVPLEQGITCPFYQEGTCKIYPVRPLVCQLFGHMAEPRMTCPRGYNTNIPTEKGVRMIRRSGEPSHFLHEFLPGFSLDKLKELVDEYVS